MVAVIAIAADCGKAATKSKVTLGGCAAGRYRKAPMQSRRIPSRAYDVASKVVS